MKVYSTILVVASLIWSISAKAQLSEGGIPPSFQYTEKGLLKSTLEPYMALSERSAEELIEEDNLIPREGYPLRVGTLIPVEIDINKTGAWSQLSNGDRIWRQTIVSPEALSIIINYKELYIPEGGKLFLYDKTKEQILGAYTHNTNPNISEFSTEETYGDEVTLEYVASSRSLENPIITISDIAHLYRGEKPSLRATGPGTSLPCMIDINCPTGADWQTQKKGVVALKVTIGRGVYVCSGSLVNNTAEDKTPYILTANHCFVIGSQEANYAISQYRFNYEKTACGGSNTDEPQAQHKTLIGATLKARSPLAGGADGMLLLLNNNVPDTWNPYYNGWDRTNVASPNGAVIHHPSGDFKKISLYSKALIPDGQVDFEDGMTDINSHWRVVYSSSVTEGGSSGSPIFNQNKLIVGTLSGGSSTCERPLWPDYYGRMSYHWDQYKDANQHMKKYLDPLNKNVNFLAGLDPNRGSSIGEEQIENSVVIFPSPFDTELNVNANSIIREIRVIDLSGREIFTQRNYRSSTITIPSGDWGSGAYTVLVKTDDGNVTRKVIK